MATALIVTATRIQTAKPCVIWADLAHCLEATRWPDELEGAGWEFGSNLGYIRSLSDYWCAMAMTGGARKQL
jgi:hypothetical protein